MSKGMGHVIRVSQWERSHFFLREKRGYPPIPPFFTPFWRARGQARLPIEPESIREERVGVFHLRFSKMVTRALPIKFGREDNLYKETGCFICLKEEQDLPVTSCCGKMVHESCLINWLEVCMAPSCPHCRTEMVTVSREKKQSEVLILGPLAYEANVLTTTLLCL